MDVLSAARSYTARGLFVVPIPAGNKGCRLKGWQNLRLTEADLPSAFCSDSNIGLILGEPSGWLVDVDLDCDEAVELAEQFLPPTPAITGREGRPRSHWWYVCENAKTIQLADPQAEGKAATLELRSTGGQTVVGPSVHPDGGRYDVLEGEPARVPYGLLEASVRALHAEILKLRGHNQPIEPAPQKPSQSLTTFALRPGDDFNQRGGLRPVLEAHKWVYAGTSGDNELWRRPGKNGDHSATFNGTTFFVHTQSLVPQFEPKVGYSKFEVFTRLAHDGDHSAAATALLAEGYGLSLPAADLSGIRAQMEEPEDEPPEPAEDAFPHPGPFPQRLLTEAPEIFHVALKYYRDTCFEYLPIAFLGSFLAAVGCVLGRRVRDRSGTRTNLYTLSLVGTGGGKEATREVVQHLFEWAGEDGPNAEIGRMTGHEDFTSDSSIYSAIRLQNPILFQIDEFGLFMQAVNSNGCSSPHLRNVTAALLKLYSKSRSVFRPKAYADSSRNFEIRQPHVCIYGTSVQSNFWAAMDQDKVEGGFLPRLLIFEDTESEFSDAIEVDPPDTVLHFLTKLYSIPCGLSRNQPVPTLLETTVDAHALLNDYRRFARAQLDESQKVTCLWTRAAENATKVAMIHACMRDWMNNFAAGDFPVIDAESARWAIDLVDYCVRQAMHRCHWCIAGGEFDRLCKEIVNYLRSCSGRQQKFAALANTFGNVPPRQWQEVRASLEAKRLVAVEYPKTGRRGRPPEVWRVLI